MSNLNMKKVSALSKDSERTKSVRIVLAPNRETSAMHGIHLLQPTYEAIARAVEVAHRRGMHLVFIHSEDTWGIRGSA